MTLKESKKKLKQCKKKHKEDLNIAIQGNRRKEVTIKQYCRYCAFCFQADEDEFRCSAEINGQQLYMTRKQINRAKSCPEFALSEMGDVVTGKQYQPKQERQEDNSQPELF